MWSARLFNIKHTFPSHNFSCSQIFVYELLFGKSLKIFTRERKGDESSTTTSAAGKQKQGEGEGKSGDQKRRRKDHPAGAAAGGGGGGGGGEEEEEAMDTHMADVESVAEEDPSGAVEDMQVDDVEENTRLVNEFAGNGDRFDGAAVWDPDNATDPGDSDDDDDDGDDGEDEDEIFDLKTVSATVGTVDKE